MVGMKSELLYFSSDPKEFPLFFWVKLRDRLMVGHQLLELTI